jgi:hypothetical protein
VLLSTGHQPRVRGTDDGMTVPAWTHRRPERHLCVELAHPCAVRIVRTEPHMPGW